jgi:hypothetical protein
MRHAAHFDVPKPTESPGKTTTGVDARFTLRPFTAPRTRTIFDLRAVIKRTAIRNPC